MKIHIVGENEAAVEGYERIEIKDGKVDLSKYSDNECSFILGSDCLDLFSQADAKGFILEVRQKLRLGGTLVLGGADIRLLARSVVSESISVEDANSLLFSKKSCLDVNTISDLVSGVGLEIISTKISGIHYEIESSR